MVDIIDALLWGLEGEGFRHGRRGFAFQADLDGFADSLKGFSCAGACSGCAFVGDRLELLGVGFQFFESFLDGCEESDDVFCELVLQFCVTDFAGLVLLAEVVDGFG